MDPAALGGAGKWQGIRVGLATKQTAVTLTNLMTLVEKTALALVAEGTAEKVPVHLMSRAILMDLAQDQDLAEQAGMMVAAELDLAQDQGLAEQAGMMVAAEMDLAQDQDLAEQAEMMTALVSQRI